MPLKPWQPFRPLSGLREQLEEKFEELVHEPWSGAHNDWQPAIDIYETADGYFVEADLPGVRPSDVTIQLRGRRLTICGSRREASASLGRGIHVERIHGTFCRTFILNEPVDKGSMCTRHENGIYRIWLAKKRL